MDFTKLDLIKAYYQIPMAEEDMPKKHLGPLPFGLFAFLRIPFGLFIAVQSFQRLIDEVPCGFPFTFVYINNVLIDSKNEQEDYTKSLKEYNISGSK